MWKREMLENKFLLLRLCCCALAVTPLYVHTSIKRLDKRSLYTLISFSSCAFARLPKLVSTLPILCLVSFTIIQYTTLNHITFHSFFAVTIHAPLLAVLVQIYLFFFFFYRKAKLRRCLVPSIAVLFIRNTYVVRKEVKIHSKRMIFVAFSVSRYAPLCYFGDDK